MPKTNNTINNTQCQRNNNTTNQHNNNTHTPTTKVANPYLGCIRSNIMPTGFIGSAPKQYLTLTTTLITTAASIHTQNAHTAPIQNEELPYTPEDASSGSFTVGTRSSNNIAADTYTYNNLSNTFINTSDRYTRHLYDSLKEIENITQTSLMMPRTVEKIDLVDIIH